MKKLIALLMCSFLSFSIFSTVVLAEGGKVIMDKYVL